MPLFEIETDAHVIITWADGDESAAAVVAEDFVPEDVAVSVAEAEEDSEDVVPGEAQTPLLMQIRMSPSN